MTTPVFHLEMLPGREGDCLILTYGDETMVRRVMIDAGRVGTYRSIRKRLASLPAGEREFELLIMSHIDRDHIAGVLSMLADPARPITFKDVWFNGFHHLHEDGLEPFGAAQAETLSELLRRPGAKWNDRLEGRSVELHHAPEPIAIEGGLTLRLLSPDRDSLAALIPDWEAECRKAGLVPGARARADGPPPGLEQLGGPIDVDELAKVAFSPDGSKPNATSIAVLAEFAGKRVLLAADGGSKRLEDSIGPLAEAEGGRLALAAFKLPHHGSRYNLAPSLLDLVDCRTFLISSNGSYFNHPDPETIARILKSVRNAELVFNYRSDEALVWQDDDLIAKWRYRPIYPSEKENGSIAVNLLA